MTDAEVRSLDESQLQRLIAREQDADQCRAEWARRWGRPYPWHKTIRGWEEA